MTEQAQTTRKDFFISYAGADRAWAEWITWQLQDAGYSTLLQTSFPTTKNFVEEMKKSLADTKNLLIVLSPDYVDALSISKEWSEVLNSDSWGEQKALIPIQVRETRNRLGNILPLLSFINLVGHDEQNAREILLAAVSQLANGSISSSPSKSVTAKQPLFPSNFPTLWNVPFQRNHLFTGREEALTQLAESLQKGNITAVTQPIAISGLGGIGKTQLAIEYAYRYRENYEAVFWVRADSRESLTAGYTEIARLLDLPQYIANDQSLTVLAVKQWLQHHLNWLLILDNADDLGIVPDFLPSAPAGHILLTTRAHSMRLLAVPLNIDSLESEDGTVLLLRRAGYIGPNSTLDMASPDDIAQGRTIVRILGGLPLALDQAGAYIEEIGCSLQDYIQRYQRHRSQLLGHRGSSISSHPQPVAATWSLTFAKIAQSNQNAIELLELCAFLAPDEIPEELIIDGASYLSSALQLVANDPFTLNSIIATLLRYSLIRRNASNKTFSIHRLVQAVIRDNMDEVTTKRWAEMAVRVVEHAFPSGEFETWLQCERLINHALLCIEWIDRYHLLFPEVIHLLNRTGYYLSVRARYQEAETIWHRALVASEQLLGTEHLDTATSLNNLAQLHQQQGRYEEAELLYQRALAIRERQLGSEHPDTAMILNNLAGLYENQGRYEEAEPLYQRALELRKKVLGEGHPDTATSMNNLALLYVRQGRYQKAEPLYQQALEISRRVLGEGHPDTATSMNNLALLYESQARYQEARTLYKQALELRRRVLGEGHPDTAASLNSLAGLYVRQGRYQEAEPLYQQALEISRRVLGEGHPDTATSMNNLALLYESQARYQEARTLYKQALELRRRVLGEGHPDTAASLNSLALLYARQGRYQEAEPLYQQALEISRRVLGEEHPDTATCVNNLAELYESQGRYAEAEPLYRQALEIRKRMLGEEHPSTATSVNNLAGLYERQGRYAEAEPLYWQVVEILKKVLGETHLTTATSVNNLAELYERQGRYAEAEPLYKKTLEIYWRVLGEEHPYTNRIKENLASLYEKESDI